MTNNTKSTVIKLGKYVINLLNKLYVKYYIGMVFTLEYNLSNKLENHSSPDICSHETFLMWGTPLEVCPNVFNAFCISRMSSDGRRSRR